MYSLKHWQKNGISEYIYTLINEPQVRPDSNIIISKCDAEYFLQNSKPSLDELSAKYYEIAPTSSEYTAYTENVKILDFFSKIDDTFCQPYAILGAVNSSKGETNLSTSPSSSSSSAVEKDDSYLAGETPIGGNDTNIENVGLAIFYKDILMGDLNGIETVCHAIISNNLETCIITIPNPYESDSNIDLFVKFKKKTRRTVSIVNNTPYIECNVKLNSRIMSMTGNSNYLDKTTMAQIEDYANSYIKYQLENYLYKTSKDFNCDIDNFGKNVVKNFKTMDEWKDFNWLDNYKNAFFKVNVDSGIKSGYLVLKT